ncbi:hypothetical protein CLAIMM_08771 isoform 1 [Cladophialophora immunda]|nr:hypothetical protein CLAIMM_08771 isoform 1 [Cladophialophora immunda]
MTGQAAADTNVPGRTCALCKAGIPWDVTFADCTYCRLPFCKHCWLQHQPSHALASVSMVHADIHDSQDRNATAPPPPCSACRKRAPSRYACLECPYTLCRGCWFSRGVNTHPHRSFKVVEPRCSVRSTTPAASSCCDAAAVNHCASCSAALALGQPVIFCKTCFVEMDEPVYRCLACYSLGGGDHHHHPGHHEPWQWTFQVAKPGWLASGIYCQKCAQPMRTVEALKGHAHTEYIDVYTEENLNRVTARSYRECQRKVMRVDGLVAHGGEQCSLCLHKTTPISSLHCQQCDQVLKLCTHCVQYGSKLHVHPIPRFNDDSNRSEHGQIRRLGSASPLTGPPHSPSVAQPSPTSPRPGQSPFTGAGPQLPRPASQSYAAPARPVAGHGIPPPRQRISSAPPQGLWSRPQSYVPGPTRPYGVAQHQYQHGQHSHQQNFLNELATSIAVASITNAVVAAESNAIYGGTNGSGAADPGTFDTSTGTTAADTGGMDTTQDAGGGGGVQVTEWTTWQDNGTAVYDSGWALDDSAMFDSSF